MPRSDGRAINELRPIRVMPNYLEFAEASVLIELGQTRVLCAVSISDRVPPFLMGKGKGWITAEYAMLPRSTQIRTPRESVTGRIGGRTHEIQRLIGRSLRASADLSALGERTFTVDCDVIQADGGTRTVAITGAYIALSLAVKRMIQSGKLGTNPLRHAVAATSVGIVGDQPLLDLCYEEDSRAEVDFNVVMNSQDEYIEVQGTAEGKPFSKETMDSLLGLAHKGILELFEVQRQYLR